MAGGVMGVKQKSTCENTSKVLVKVLSTVIYI